MKRAGVRSAGNPHAAYDEAEVGDGVKERTEAPDNGESLRQTAIPRPCGHRASFRPYWVETDKTDPENIEANGSAISKLRKVYI